MATTSISLIREQSEAVRPPRALWVPFALGRPLGSAADPDFQPEQDEEYNAELHYGIHFTDWITVRPNAASARRAC